MGPALTPADQWRRFDRLAWCDTGAVGGPAWRQIARLDAAQRPAAEARLALKRDDPSARALVAALPGGAAVDPALMLELAKWLRRAGQDDDASETVAGAGRGGRACRAARTPRHVLGRAQPARPPPAARGGRGRRLRPGRRRDGAGARAGDRRRVPGRLHRPAPPADTDAADRHFRALAGLSHAAITQGRAWYWLGRTAEARRDAAGARTAYAAAAAWPTTFYGQLAARALGEDDAALAARIRAARDPGWTPARALEFVGSENARAAALLVEWGEVAPRPRVRAAAGRAGGGRHGPHPGRAAGGRVRHARPGGGDRPPRRAGRGDDDGSGLAARGRAAGRAPWSRRWRWR